MKNLKVRKTVLLSIAGALLVAYILMLIFGNASKTKVLSVKQDIDTITIENPAEETGMMTLYKNNDIWVMGQQQLPVKQALVQKMNDVLKEITLIGEVTKALDEDSRYGLTPDNAITVKAYASGKEVRCLYIGKNTQTGSQSYVRTAEKSSIYLSSGAIRNDFKYTVDDLVEKTEAADDSVEEEVSQPVIQ